MLQFKYVSVSDSNCISYDSNVTVRENTDTSFQVDKQHLIFNSVYSIIVYSIVF